MTRKFNIANTKSRPRFLFGATSFQFTSLLPNVQHNSIPLYSAQNVKQTSPPRLYEINPQLRHTENCNFFSFSYLKRGEGEKEMPTLF